MNKELLKKIGATVLAMAIPAGLGLSLSACGNNTNEKTPVVDFDKEQDYIYYSDGSFNKEGFVRTFNEFMNLKLNNIDETFNQFLNSQYTQSCIPLFAFYDQQSNAVKFASAGTFSSPITDNYGIFRSGELRIVSFTPENSEVNLSDCSTWSEFREKFLNANVNISYDIIASYNNFIKSNDIVETDELDNAMLSLANDCFNNVFKNQGYNNEVNSGGGLAFVGLSNELYFGMMVSTPLSCLYFDEETNEIKYVQVDIEAATLGGWENNIINRTNFIVLVNDSEAKIIGKINETFIDLSDVNNYQLEVENDDVAEADIDKNYSDAERVK